MSKVSIKRPEINKDIHNKIDNLNSIQDIKDFLKEMFPKKLKIKYKHNKLRESNQVINGTNIK